MWMFSSNTFANGEGKRQDEPESQRSFTSVGNQVKAGPRIAPNMV